MRKYFLLSAVAILITTTANAASDVTGNIGVNATIKHIQELNCSEFNLGTIYIKTNGQPSTVTTSGAVTGAAVFAEGGTDAECTGDFSSLSNIDSEQRAEFGPVIGEGEDAAQLEFYIDEDSIYELGAGGEGVSIGGMLHIPANYPAGSYEGTYTLYATAE
ncbi:MAG: hypothetical protein E7016_00740 [Alphaproteobacteria bacterium]|nr:hypothetical protein [Alphaproteobacteria bacterium]